MLPGAATSASWLVQPWQRCRSFAGAQWCLLLRRIQVGAVARLDFCMCLQEREAFLQQFRFTGSTEDFEVAMRAYEWPRKFAGNLREASGKANSGKGCAWKAAKAASTSICSGCGRCPWL